MTRARAIPHGLLIATLCLGLSPGLARGEGKRAVDVKVERVDLAPSTSVDLDARAQYVIIKRPSKSDQSAEVTRTFRQDAPEKLVVAGHGRAREREERVVFSFSPKDAGPDELANVEVPVRYTVTVQMPDGTAKSMTRETTFVLPDRDRKAPLATCLRIQEFPGLNVRVGLSPCGQPWSSP